MKFPSVMVLALCAPALFSPAQAESKFEQAEEVYVRFCVRCHGRKLVNPGTMSFDLMKFPKDQKARFYRSVRKGKRRMPPLGDLLRPGELDLLWFYVNSRAGKELPAAGKKASLKKN